jgi:hypothetical protein
MGEHWAVVDAMTRADRADLEPASGDAGLRLSRASL